MMRRSSLHALLALLLVLPLTGCLFSREIAQTRRDIEKAYPDLRLEKQIVVNLGPLSLKTLGWMSAFVPDPEVDVARSYLKDIRRIKVGVFRSEQPEDIAKLDVGQFGFDEDWEVAVRARQEGEHVWVLYKEEAETVRDLYVVVLGDEELVVARLRGRLDRLLARVMEDHVELGDWVGSTL
jgi:hypothetical protein